MLLQTDAEKVQPQPVQRGGRQFLQDSILHVDRLIHNAAARSAALASGLAPLAVFFALVNSAHRTIVPQGFCFPFRLVKDEKPRD
jgi:hypothetical protein